MSNFVRDRQAGFSLVELMIAMLLGAFILGGLVQLFVTSKQIYRVQENLSRLQENGRFAVNFLTRDLRMADYWGCLGSTTSIESNLNPGSIYDNFNTAIIATNDAGLNGSDSITISGAAPSGIFVVDIPANPSADLKVTDNSGLDEDDVVIVSDCSAGDIFQITNDPGTGGAPGKDEVVHNTGAVNDGPGNADKPFQKVYGTDAQIYKLTSISYSIATGAGGRPSLFRSINGGANQELVEGVENMQILYGEDTDADGTPNYYVPAGTGGLNLDNVVSVRVSLVVLSLDDNVATAPVAYTVFGNETTPADRRIRHVFTSTVAVRNRLL